MKKIKKIQANGFYIFRGEVAANSNFIETINEAKQFLIYANFFLNRYLTVYDYNITRHEWQMVVKLKSVDEICPSENESSEEDAPEQLVWRIISERMRLFLSQYVKAVNRMRGRTGTLVHSSYERYYFNSLHEAKAVIEGIRKQTFRMYNRKPKYRGLKKHYKIPKRLGFGSIFLCSKEIKMDRNQGRNFLENQYLSELRDFVLLELIHSTQIQQNPKTHLKPYPKRE